MQEGIIIFDDSIRQELHDLVTHTQVFSVDKKLKRNYQLVCVMNDRLADAIAYLNQHNGNAPKTLEEYYSFMAFADNLYEGVRLAYEQIVFDSKVKVRKSWDELCRGIQSYFCEKGVSENVFKLTKRKRLPDNTFFRYLRALTFAHPFETTEFKFINKKKKQDRKCPDTHYCPLVKFGDNVISLPSGWRRDDTIEIIAYAHRWYKSVPFHVSYSAILQFLKSRYELLNLVITHVRSLIENRSAKWRMRKIGRKYDSVIVLQHLARRLRGRGLIANDIESMIQFLKTEVNPRYPRNVRCSERFKQAIKNAISGLCGLFDAQDNKGFYRVLNDLTNPTLPSYDGKRLYKKYHMVINHRDRIIQCLNESLFDRGNLNFGVRKLSESFVNKWVTLDTETMEVQEIWLLICTAWYLEHQDCVKRGILRDD